MKHIGASECQSRRIVAEEFIACAVLPAIHVCLVNRNRTRNRTKNDRLVTNESRLRFGSFVLASRYGFDWHRQEGIVVLPADVALPDGTEVPR